MMYSIIVGVGIALSLLWIGVTLFDHAKAAIPPPRARTCGTCAFCLGAGGVRVLDGTDQKGVCLRHAFDGADRVVSLGRRGCGESEAA